MKYIYLASILVSLGALSACSGADKSNEKKTEEETKSLVKIETVNEREVIQEGNYTATVEPDLINNISASSPNRIKQIFVDEGMRVSKGRSSLCSTMSTRLPMKCKWPTLKPALRM